MRVPHFYDVLTCRSSGLAKGATFSLETRGCSRPRGAWQWLLTPALAVLGLFGDSGVKGVHRPIRPLIPRLGSVHTASSMRTH